MPSTLFSTVVRFASPTTRGFLSLLSSLLRGSSLFLWERKPLVPGYRLDPIKKKLYQLIEMHTQTLNAHTIMIPIDPLHIMGMQPIWRTKQNKFSLLGIEIYSHLKKSYCFVFQIGCISMDVQGVCWWWWWSLIFHLLYSSVAASVCEHIQAL